MGKMFGRLFPVLVLALLCTLGSAIFNEDVNLNTRRATFIGLPNSAFVSTSKKQLLVATDAGAIATLSSRSGDLVWRYALTEGQQLADVYFSNERIFALILESQSSALNPTRAFVRALDAKDGAMIWERVLISDTSIKGNSFELTLNASQDYLSVLCNDSVYLLSAANGSISNSYSERKVLASHFTNGSTIAALVADNSAIQVVKLAQNAATETVPINDIQYSSESLAIAGANGSGNGSFLLSSLETSKAYVVCDAQVNALDFVDAFQRKDVTSINVVPHSFTDGALINQGKPSVSVVRLGNADGSVVFAKFDACSDAPFTVLRAATASGAIVHASIVFAGASYSEPVLYVFEQAPGKVTSSAVRVDTAEAIDVPPLKQTSEPINYEVETRYLRVFGVPIIGNAESTPGSLQTNQLWRNLIVTEAGYVEFTSDKKVYWSRSEFEAMVESSVVVDVPSSSEQLRVLPSLSFVSRLIDQGFQVTRFVKNALGKLSYLLRELTADPAYTLESLFSGQHEVYAPDTMAPSSTPFQQLIVTLSNTFAGKLSQRVPFPFLHSSKDTFQEITGVLHGKILDTGAPLWTRALPLSAAARKIAASLDPETRGMAKSHLLVSRSRPFAGQPSQVVLVETTPASADLNQFHVSVSWVNTISGKVIRAMEYYTASPLAAITPVNKAASSLDEKQYLLTHAQYPGALPQFATVVPPASHFTGSFDTVYSTFTYNVQTSMEGIAGYGLGPKAIEQNAPVTRLTCEGQSCSNVQFFPTIVRWTHTLSAPVYTPESEEKGAPERLLAYTFHDSVSGKTASGGSVAAEKGVQALSDDSLLLKWNTENILAVVTGVPGARISFFERQREYTYFYAHKIAKTEPYKGFTVVVSTVEPQTNLVLLDTVTGKVVHLRSQPGSTGPCSVVLVDSWVSYTFWSDAGKRSEVAVFALYEGAIDSHDLTPWSKVPVAVKSAPLYSYTSSSPVILQKSYIFPVSIKQLTYTRSEGGITPVSYLTSSASNEIVAYDKRIFDPRRSDKEPKESDKLEGLIPYSPYLPLPHNKVLTYGQPVEGLHTLFSVPTGWESTSLVVGLGLDHFVTRFSPAKQFDQLNPDFHSGLFFVFMTGAFIAALVLRKSHNAKRLEEQWK